MALSHTATRTFEFLFWIGLLALAGALQGHLQTLSLDLLRAYPEQLSNIGLALKLGNALCWLLIAFAAAKFLSRAIKALDFRNSMSSITTRLIEGEVFLLIAVFGIAQSTGVRIELIALILFALLGPAYFLFRDAINDVISGVWLVTHHQVSEQSHLDIPGLGPVQLVQLNMTTSVLRRPDGRISVWRNSRLQNTSFVLEDTDIDQFGTGGACVFAINVHPSVSLALLTANVTASALHAGWRPSLPSIGIDATELSGEGVMFTVRVPRPVQASAAEFRTALLVYFAQEQVRSGIAHQGAPLRAPDKEIVLGRSTVFESLGKDELRDVAEACTWRVTEPGEILCEKGEQGEEMWIVDRGMVEVALDNQDYAFVGGESVLGEIAMLSNTPRGSTCRTACHSRFLTFTKSRIREVMQAHPDVVRALWVHAHERMAHPTEASEEAVAPSGWFALLVESLSGQHREK